MKLETLNPSELQRITNDIFKDNIRNNDFGYLSDMKVENLFTISYKSRYFLELLQNARDAIVEGRVEDGKVKAWVEDNVFYFANNGVNFSSDGVNSICYPAISTKTDPTMVGHKGIGFNAVREISVKPEVVTNFGTFYFDVDHALVKLGRTNRNLPLFRYPMYKSQTIVDIDQQLVIDGFTTVFKFPLKEEIDSTILELSIPATEDMIFLSAIKKLQINNSLICIDDDRDPVIINEDGKERRFKQYRSEFEFTKVEIDTFAPDESAQFSKSGDAESVFLLELDEQGRFKKTDSAKLHLFYGLDFVSGFSFSLHSYFSVSIERKSLMEGSKLNNLLFNHISLFYTNKLIDLVKIDFPGQELDILAFKREGNNRMNKLYDQIKIGLKEQNFIFHPLLEIYLKPSQLYLVSKEDYDVFRDGKLGDQFLYINDAHSTFLQNEMGVATLPDYFIKANIEEKAEQYKRDPLFFHELYLLIERRKLNASDKKILLTTSGNLVAGNDTDIYYQPTNKYTTPEVLENDIAFLNSNIDIDNLRGGLSKYLLVREFNSATLIRRSIKILQEKNNMTVDDQNLIIELLHFLVQLEFTDLTLIRSLRNTISLPVKNMKTKHAFWVKQYSRPIYFEDFQYGENYEGDFDVVDYVVLRVAEEEKETWKSFLLLLGVWEIPGIYLKTSPGALNTIYPESEVLNDPALHIPAIIDLKFFEVILNRWSTYDDFLRDDRAEMNMSIPATSKLSFLEKIKYSSLYSQLREMSWIPAVKKDSAKGQKILQFFRPDEVVAISSSESIKTHNAVVYEFLPIIVIDTESYSRFCDSFDILHLQGKTVVNFGGILVLLEKLYPNPEEVINKKGLKNLSNRILSFLFDFLNRSNQKSNIEYLKETRFLGEGVVDQKMIWLEGKYCLHIDDKNFLDVLNENHFLDSLSHPYAFTKKDKKEWGKFANKIGRSVRKMVTTELKSEGIEENTLLHLNHPEVIIGFVEEDLDRNYTDDEILAYKDIQLIVHPVLEMVYSLEEKDNVVLQSFHITDDAVPKLHICRNALSNKHLLALAITEWLERYTKTELVRFHLIIEQVLELVSRNAAFNYAADQDVDEVRLQYISNLLRYKYYTEDDTIIAQPPAFTEQVVSEPLPIKYNRVMITEERSVINLETEGQLEDYFTMLDEKLMIPSKPFISRIVLASDAEMIVDYPKVVASVTQVYRPGGAELSDKAKTEIGFLAELYIHKKLNIAEPTLIGLMGLDLNQIGDFQWLNIHRLDNIDLPDGSRGHGHDFYLPVWDLAIEVKGMLGNTGFITITGKEFDSMRIRRERYFLVIVKNMLAEAFNTIVIQDPYQKILSGELMFLESKISL